MQTSMSPENVAIVVISPSVSGLPRRNWAPSGALGAPGPPIVPLVTFRYHYAFHANAYTFMLFTGIESHIITSLLAQLLVPVLLPAIGLTDGDTIMFKKFSKAGIQWDILRACAKCHLLLRRHYLIEGICKHRQVGPFHESLVDLKKIAL